MVGEPGLPTLSKGAVVFSQLSDGLLEAHPTPPERIVVRRHNAMGAHAPLARVELAGDEVPATVGELREKLYALFAISRRQRVDLFFWGKRLDDDATSLLDCRSGRRDARRAPCAARGRASKRAPTGPRRCPARGPHTRRISTNSELTLATSARTRAELALLREASALRRVRICSNKVVSFTIGNVSRETTVAELRRAVHAHLHAPLSYLAIESWKPDADSLVFHRGDQVRTLLPLPPPPPPRTRTRARACARR